MDPYHMRRATVEDAAGVAHVKYHSWQSTYRGIISDSYLDAMSVDELTSTWQKILSPINTRNATDILTDHAGRAIGFISYAKYRNEEMNADGEIMALYLLKEYQGKGLGARLFGHGIVQLASIGVYSFFLNVLATNPSLDFYRKFKPDRECPVKITIDGIEYDDIALMWNDSRNIVMNS